jgi:hypothetical protein
LNHASESLRTRTILDRLGNSFAPVIIGGFDAV